MLCDKGFKYWGLFGELRRACDREATGKKKVMILGSALGGSPGSLGRKGLDVALSH